VLITAAPQLVLSAQYLAHAYRWVGADAPIAPGQPVPYRVFAYQSILTPADLLHLLDPWRWSITDANAIYVGTTTLWLGVWFLARRARRQSIPAWREHGPWLTVLGIGGIIVMLGHYTFIPRLLRRLPVLGSVRELGRYAVLWQLFASVLAACSIEALSKARPRNFWRGGGALFGAVFAALLLLYWGFVDRSVLSPPAIIALAGMLLVAGTWHVFGAGRVSALLASASLALTAVLFAPEIAPDARIAPPVDVAFATHPLLRPLEQEYGQARVLIDESTGLPQNYADAHRLQTVSGHAATMYVRYFDFWSRDASPAGEYR
jgi:hypothetical protein